MWITYSHKDGLNVIKTCGDNFYWPIRQFLELPLPYSIGIYCGHLLVFRIYVDLPDAENRVKILRIFLAQENIEPEFQFEKLADATEGYSGSDLKVISQCLVMTGFTSALLILLYFAEPLYCCSI